MGIRSYRDLVVWQKAMDLAVAVYALTKEFPRSEQFALTSQLNRAAVSVPANIAEGSARSTSRDYLHFLSIARGSLNEAETYLLLAERLGYGRPDDRRAILERMDEIGRMLTMMRRRLR